MGEEFNTALTTGIRTEIDGLEMYQRAADRSTNPLGKALFESLVADERNHLKALEVRAGEDWRKADDTPRDRIRTVFQEATKNIKERLAADPDDVEAIKVALEFEKKGYQSYKDSAAKVTDPKGKALLEWLAGEENEHFRILQDLLEYLEKSYSWFVANDGPILDGG